MNDLAPMVPQEYISRCKVVKLKQGICFMHAAEEAEYVYILQQGTVSVTSIRGNGAESELSPIAPGNTIGEMEVVRGISEYLHSATTLQDSILIRMERDAFLSWIKEDHEASLWLNRVLAEKLLDSMSQTPVTTRYDSLHRLMKHLLILGSGKQRLTHKQLADACSMSLRTMQRCVDKLEAMGLVTINRGKMEITEEQIKSIRTEMNKKES